MEMYCNHCLDHSKSIFNILNKEEKHQLKINYKCKKIKKNEIIFSEGDRPVGLICLASGNVKVFKEGVSGREQIVRMAKPIGFIGYRALFAEESHTTTAVALEDSIVCIFSKESLFKVMKNNWVFSREIIKSLASELGLSFTRTVTLTQKHIRGRLAEALIFLKQTYGYENDGCTINTHLSREDIAHLANMTTSNAIRTLTKFAKENLIKLDGKSIKIIDYHQLENISEMG